jgi:hypothetical protein
LYDGVLLQGARFDGFSHVDDWVRQRVVTATGPNPLPRLPTPFCVYTGRGTLRFRRSVFRRCQAGNESDHAAAGLPDHHRRAY